MKETGSGAAPDVGDAVPATETTPVTVIVALLHCAVCEAESVTVTIAVNVPPMLYT